MNALITVIVPVYNVEKYLDKCIDSIVNQTYKNLEIILVDDGSPDNCPQMCDAWAEKDSRIKVIHKSNGGVSSARNAGLDIAQGDYIGFVDGDDFIEKNMYECLSTAMINKNADIVVCNNTNLTEDNKQLDVAAYKNNSFEGNDIVKKFIEGNSFDATSTCNKLFGIDAIMNNRFDTRIKVGEDLLFNYHCMKNVSKLTVIEDVLYNYIFHNKSAMRTAGVDTVTRYKNIKLILDNEKENPDNYNSALYKYQSELLCCMRELLRSKNKELIDKCYNDICDEIKKYSYDFLQLNISKANRLSIILICYAKRCFKGLYSLFLRLKNEKN